MTYHRHRIAATLEHARTLFRRWRPGPFDRDALSAIQRRKVAALIAHARANVALYRDHWRETDPRLATLDALPTIGKDDFRARAPEGSLVRGARIDRLVVRATSGSSGQPFATRRTSTEDHLMQLFRMRAEADAGVRRGDRILRFMQVPHGGYRRTLPGRVRNALGLWRDDVVDGLADGAALVEAIDRLRPDAIRGYPSTMMAIAHELARRGRRGTSARIVIAGGEVLGAATRREIAESMRVKVFAVYGMSEFNLLASQCPAGAGFHVCDDNVVLEVLGPDGREVGPGGTGEVVATALHAWTMPFVRYRTGDLATRGASRCACGAPWTTLAAIRGRAVDLLKLPDGREIHPYRITGGIADGDEASIVQHQLVQERRNRVVLTIATRGTPSTDLLARLRAIGERELGPAVAFEVQTVDAFACPPGTKFPPYVSRLAAASRSDASA